jgi:hypothetical protein
LIIFAANASFLSAINWANCGGECAHHHAAPPDVSIIKTELLNAKGVSETERFVCVALAKSQLRGKIFTFA